MRRGRITILPNGQIFLAPMVELTGRIDEGGRTPEVARGTIRMVLSSLKNRRIELGRDLEEAEELQVLNKAVKSREDSAAQYDAADRTELAAQERAEIEVIRGYLPEAPSEDDVRALVQAKIEELGIDSKRQLGQLMKGVMAEGKGRLDGKLVQRIASELLG